LSEWPAPSGSAIFFGFAVKGVMRNMADWYEAFGVTEDDEIYLLPERRAMVW